MADVVLESEQHVRVDVGADRLDGGRVGVRHDLSRRRARVGIGNARRGDADHRQRGHRSHRGERPPGDRLSQGGPRREAGEASGERAARSRRGDRRQEPQGHERPEHATKRRAAVDRHVRRRRQRHREQHRRRVRPSAEPLVARGERGRRRLDRPVVPKQEHEQPAERDERRTRDDRVQHALGSLRPPARGPGERRRRQEDDRERGGAPHGHPRGGRPADRER